MFEKFSIEELNVVLYALGRYAQSERESAKVCSSDPRLDQFVSSRMRDACIAERLYKTIIVEQLKRNQFV